MKPAPAICSCHEDDVDLREAIEEMIIGLGERTDCLQDTHAAGTMAALIPLCEELAADSRRLGFPQLEQLSQCIITAASRDASEEAEKLIQDLTEVVQRVRKGSRGAV